MYQWQKGNIERQLQHQERIHKKKKTNNLELEM